MKTPTSFVSMLIAHQGSLRELESTATLEGHTPITLGREGTFTTEKALLACHFRQRPSRESDIAFGGQCKVPRHASEAKSTASQPVMRNPSFTVSEPA